MVVARRCRRNISLKLLELGRVLIERGIYSIVVFILSFMCDDRGTRLVSLFECDDVFRFLITE